MFQTMASSTRRQDVLDHSVVYQETGCCIPWCRLSEDKASSVGRQDVADQTKVWSVSRRRVFQTKTSSACRQDVADTCPP